jgi:exodeoxyribonuclease-3
MRVATFNTNSIRVRLPVILDWLNRHQPDILCIQETKVQDKDFPVGSFEAAGYKAVFKGQKSYNGVAVISKLPLEEVRWDLESGVDDAARFISGRVHDIPVINVYVPQGYSVGSEKFSYKLRWLRDLLSHIKGLYEPGEPLLLAGDFNVALEPVDVYDPEGLAGEVGFHPHEQEILREFLTWGFVDVFRKYESGGGRFTFWDYRIPNGFRRNMGWRIDYILATASLAKKSQKAWIDTGPRQQPKPSDHTFLVAEFDLDD